MPLPPICDALWSNQGLIIYQGCTSDDASPLLHASRQLDETRGAHGVAVHITSS